MKPSWILAIILILSLLIFAFAGCSSSKDGDGESTQGGSSTYQKYMDWLKQFDKWVDSYITVCKNYNNNPLSYMSDYLTKTAELAEWTAKFENVDGDDLTTAEVAIITNEYLRIYNKMLKGVSGIN